MEKIFEHNFCLHSYLLACCSLRNSFLFSAYFCIFKQFSQCPCKRWCWSCKRKKKYEKLRRFTWFVKKTIVGLVMEFSTHEYKISLILSFYQGNEWASGKCCIFLINVASGTCNSWNLSSQSKFYLKNKTESRWTAFII